MPEHRVLVCGNVVFDILARPVEDVRWAATTVVDEISQQLGGNAGSTSYTIAKLGRPVSLVSLVGRDATAETVLAQLQTAGVDTSLVQYVNAPTSIAISLIRGTGERALLYYLGAASEDFAEFEFPPGASWFHLAAVYRMRHLRTIAPALLMRAKAAGLITSLDTQWDTAGEWMSVLAPSLPFTDFTLLNEDEARMLTGHPEPDLAAAVLRERGAAHVIVKLGPRGCWADGTLIPGHTVDTVDTTGAGDCFSGAFVAAMSRGLAIDEAARFANAVGAMAVQSVGATAGVADWNSTLRFLESR